MAERTKTGQFAPSTSIRDNGPKAVTSVTPQVSEVSSVTKISAGERLLNEALRDVQNYLNVTESQAVALTLYAAATHAVQAFPAFGRLFFGASGPESGKTVGMQVATCLASNAENAQGSSYALTSLLAQAHNSPEQPTPCLYRDEIQGVFGTSGLNTSKDPIAMVLREGYKRGATTSWSVNRVAEKISLYVPVIMAGLGTALPTDIRSRSIVIQMVRGRPQKDFDSDGAEYGLRQTGRALGSEVRSHMPEMRKYNCDGAVPGLTGRKHQVWRPLIAVAKFVGGPRWHAMALVAFQELTQSGGAAEILSADQMLLKDLAGIVTDMELAPDEWVGGMQLAEELSTLQRFEGRTTLSIARDVAAAMPVESIQKRAPGTGKKPRGYLAADVIAAWDAAKPATPEEIQALEAEEMNPFA